mmetsp:Transcript_7526/g.13695  ORF Transcript_7526/g.13695 Transcript_7526/m.13695 type:complete len:1252 (+) Transcript_7526:65-3820(+)|eukprot:CAMPEP_0203747056 /NCGR_PEP_ID=MMETSP0098-20131031/2312_1 /ASSEMBLY_ACC=CAM_ASM_000208 /TAXON_ID=96639 /ORGANISM=" , Strain NY0313808BC1" /LENGTH=1251 /DNA_ID=CAMNT_0050635359 /DNA_START=38 /DNA_END=3793 /DNA_ORIENTATION=+
MYHPKLRSLEEDVALMEAGKLKSSVSNVVNLRKDKADTDREKSDGTKPSPFQGKRVRFDFNDEDSQVFEKLNAEDRKTSVGGIMKQIQENDTKDATKKLFLPPKKVVAEGFPALFDAGTTQNGQTTKKGKNRVSLFKQMRLKERGETVEDMPDSKTSQIPMFKLPKGELASEVDSQNNSRLSQMNQREILEAQKEIRGTFNPELLDKFLSKISINSQPSESKTLVEKTDAKPTDDISWIKTQEDLDEAVNTMLPKHEKEKLRWTGRIREDESSYKMDETESADNAGGVLFDTSGYRPSSETVRFGLDGVHITSNTESSASSGLFHHSEDQEKPGYTVGELMRLARSKVAAQKSVALNVFGQILANRQICLYGKDIPKFSSKREQLLVSGRHPLFTLPRQLAMVIRLGMDNSNATVVSSALNAMASFLVPYVFVDQVCSGLAIQGSEATCFLPSVVPRAQGSVEVYGAALDDVDVSAQWGGAGVQGLECNEDDTTDVELIESSPVGGLVATGLIARISFLLGCDPKLQTGVDLTPEGLVSALRILTLISLHSDKGLMEVIQNKHLLEHVLNKTIKLIENCTGLEQVLASYMELLLILAASRQDIAQHLTVLAPLILKAHSREPEKQSPGIALLNIWVLYGFDEVVTAIYENSLLVNKPFMCMNQGLWGVSVRAALEKKLLSAHDVACVVNQAIDLSFEDIGAFHAFHAFVIGHYGGEVGTLEEDISLVLQDPSVGPTEIPDKAVSKIVNQAVEVIERRLTQGNSEDELVWLSNVNAVLRTVHGLVQHEHKCRGKFQECRLAFCRLFSSIPDVALEAHASASPYTIGLYRSRLQVKRTLARIQVLLFGSLLETNNDNSLFELGTRRRMICQQLIPRIPRLCGLESTTFKLISALLSPSVLDVKGAKQLLLPLFRDLLGGRAGILNASRNSGPKLSFRIDFALANLDEKAQKLERVLDRKWRRANSAWPIVPIILALREQDTAVVVTTLKAGVILMEDSAMNPEDVIMLLVRFVIEADSDLIFEAEVMNLMNLLLDVCFRLLLKTQVAYVSKLEKAAGGGRAKLIALCQQLVVAYNERLNGHSTATAILLFMLRMDGCAELRSVLWAELLGGNLLRLLQPPHGPTVFDCFSTLDPYCLPVETDGEVLQCMSSALCEKALTRANNSFLYEIAVYTLASYLWIADFTWGRKRLLKQLVVAGVYLDVSKCDPSKATSIQDSLSAKALHTRAIGSLRMVAREEPAVWSRVQSDGQVEL